MMPIENNTPNIHTSNRFDLENSDMITAYVTCLTMEPTICIEISRIDFIRNIPLPVIKGLIEETQHFLISIDKFKSSVQNIERWQYYRKTVIDDTRNMHSNIKESKISRMH